MKPCRGSCFRLVLPALLALGLLVGGVLWWNGRESTDVVAQFGEPVDPRLQYTGPFRNVRPDVAFTGDAACKECHEELAATYSQHSMGRSLSPLVADAGEPGSAAKVLASFEALGSQFIVEQRDGKIFHRQLRRDAEGNILFEHELPAHFAIGSGTSGHSYLSVSDGFVVQTPISWYTQQQLWDLSPGFNEVALAGRPVHHECLFCHSQRALELQGYRSRYQPQVFEGCAIGCERCHGPGELHVRERRQGLPIADNFDDTIVNPRHLPPPLRESVCQQCHLEGEIRVLRRGRGHYDFRPGLHLREFFTVLVNKKQFANRQAVNHTEQMHVSRCFQASAGANQLGCITCHDTHAAISAERRVAHYRAACLKCHQVDSCTLPLEERSASGRQDSCIDCHMPRYHASDVAHTAATDHRIVRRPDPAASAPPERVSAAGDALVLFFDPVGREVDDELRRDIAVGRIRKMLLQGDASPDEAALAVKPLRAALARDKSDLDAWECLGVALQFTQQPDEGLRLLDELLLRHPRRESALVAAASIASQIRPGAAAADYWRRLVQVAPRNLAYWQHYAAELLAARQWAEAETACRQCVALAPWLVEARRQWARCLTQLGKHDAALEQERLAKLLAQPESK